MRRFHVYPLVLVAGALLLSGCQLPFFNKKSKPVGVVGPHNFASDRVVNTTIVKKVVGKKSFFIFSLDKTSSFLEGYLQGRITDYDGRPIEGVVVRAALDTVAPVSKKGKENREAQEILDTEFKGFDPGVTDSAGIYQIRFSLPLVKGVLDVNGKFLYNPGWDQQGLQLGHTYQPQIAESKFRFYFDRDSGLIGFDEGLRSTVVHSTRETDTPKPSGPPVSYQPSSPSVPGQSKTKPPVESPDDLFKSFGFGQ